MNRILILLFVILSLPILTGCAGKLLKEDPVIPSVKANYPTLEFRACGELYHGVGTCYLSQGQNHDSVNLKIQGYYRGTGRVYSSNCQIEQTFTYGENELISVKLPQLEPGRSCLVSMVLSPEFPPEWRSGISVYSLKGLLAIRIQKGQERWGGFLRKLTGEFKSQVDIPIGDVYQSARVVARGCGIDYDKQVPLDKGFLHLQLHEVVSYKLGDCILEGAVLTTDSDRTFTGLVTQYATTLPADPEWQQYGFIPLAIPKITVSESTLEVIGQDQVSVVSLNSKYEINSKAKFKFDPSKINVVRLITVKGRTVLGVWDPKTQSFKWGQ